MDYWWQHIRIDKQHIGVWCNGSTVASKASSECSNRFAPAN